MLLSGESARVLPQHPYIGDPTNSENDLPNVVMLGHRVISTSKLSLPLCTIAQASPTPMDYCTSQPHPCALLHKPAPPLCTIAQASPTPIHYCTSQPHPYGLLHKPATPLCTIAQASPTPMHYCKPASPHADY